MKVEINLEQDDVDLLGRYLCQDWSKNQGNFGDIFGSTFWDAVDKHFNGKSIKWSHTPSIEAEELMKFILDTYDRVSYPSICINFYWEK